jgi:hypothetical protein
MMKSLLCLTAAILLPAVAWAQEDCEPSGRQLAAFPRISAAVMDAPVLGATELAEGEVTARADLVLARQSVRVAPRTRYLAAPVVLADANGRALAEGVPLGRGAPITTWRDSEGLKQCAIGWRNGLFGGVTGDGHMRWVCLEDRDGDGAFENAWRTVSRSMGLSYSRLDMPIAPPVATLDAPPADAVAMADGRTSVLVQEFERTILVTRINAERVQIESRLGQDGRHDRIERRDVPLSGPSEVTLSGITIAVTPAGRGAARVTARGSFAGADIRLLCQGSRLEIGEMRTMTQFGFGNW